MWLIKPEMKMYENLKLSVCQYVMFYQCSCSSVSHSRSFLLSRYRMPFYSLKAGRANSVLARVSFSVECLAASIW